LRLSIHDGWWGGIIISGVAVAIIGSAIIRIISAAAAKAEGYVTACMSWRRCENHQSDKESNDKAFHEIPL
jgi:hypothetical protein